jgi:hypothetical protein
MRHVVVHVAFGLRCARGGGRASALKAGVESRPLSPSDSVARRDLSSVVAHVHVAGSERGAAAWGREVGSAVGSTCDGFFLGTDSTLQTRPQNGARPCAIMHLWHARAYGRRARYRQSSARKRREYGVMRGTLSTACLLVPFDTKAAS